MRLRSDLDLEIADENRTIAYHERALTINSPPLPGHTFRVHVRQLPSGTTRAYGYCECGFKMHRASKATLYRAMRQHAGTGENPSLAYKDNLCVICGRGGVRSADTCTECTRAAGSGGGWMEMYA